MVLLQGLIDTTGRGRAKVPLSPLLPGLDTSDRGLQPVDMSVNL